MNAIDLTIPLSKYKSGWVAVNEDKKEIVAHAKTFSEITQKVKKLKNIVLIPASDNYFGFITNVNG
ncbi:hypothetical protein A2Z00_05250 [Candidatus Gottesmanbacteria bacterium RBG_13_45_10]|uniref:DUF5678 domain-containing protein n=1 Tax=Candidatus Gottesmanbacteria bacterium RBG_13_45_10 TaxID=1798370 RepID=A0A1F5ZH13_9BACT|nr:MAG: hypothetical protein A2Z00_05250 [Candidatus Gottesmanbacteria bacterium RBG_13_45_10]